MESYTFFHVWLLPISVIFLRFISIVAWISTSLLYVNDYYSIMWINIFFIHSFVDRYLGCFHFLAIMNNAAMNIPEQIFVKTHFHFFWIDPKSEVAGSYGFSMFNILRRCQAGFQSECTILHFLQQSMNIPMTPYPHQHLMLPVFLLKPF